MKIYIFLVVVFFFIGCVRQEESNIPSKIKDKNSFINKSQNKKFPLEYRLRVIDSVYFEHLNKGVDSTYLAIIFQKSNLHYDLKQIDSSFYYDQQLLRKSKEKSNDYYSGKAHANLGFHFNYRKKHDSAFYHYVQSKNYFYTLRFLFFGSKSL